MPKEILIGVLITIVGAPVLWFLKIVLGRPILRFLKKTRGAVASRFGKVKGKDSFHQYNEKYTKRHGQLQVFCVGMEEQSSVDDVYVVVQFLAKRKATKHNSTEEVGKVFLQKGRGYFTSTSDERQDGMRVATNEQYLMVLGVPGVGKSTFLRKVGLEALKGEDGNLEHQCIPVFLELRRFTKDPIDIKAWIINEFKVCGYPYPEQWANSKLESGELLILFDGLDEMPKPDLSTVINKIRDFVHQYSQNRFIASCRVGAYKGEFSDFTEVEMADFDDSQIQDYINKQFASPSNRKMKTAQRCWQTLNDPEHQAIKELAQNPLSLALLCQVYEDSQDFPSSETILYGKILNIFLKKWTAEKHVHRDPPMSPYLAIPTVKELLSEIAAENFKADRLVFSEDELINQIQEFYQRRTDISAGFDASGILDALLVDPGLFVERASGIYSFFHLTFQEYLTANHIAGNTPSIQYPVNQHLNQNLYDGQWEKVLLLTNSIQYLVDQNLYDWQWRKVLLLTAELMSEADGLLLVMEAEAAEYINSSELEVLLRWAEKITDDQNDQYNKITKQLFAIRQFFSLWMLNQIYEEVDNIIDDDPDYDDPDYDDPELDQRNYHDFEFYNLLDLGQDLYQALEQDLYKGLDRNFSLYQGSNRYFDLYFDLCSEIDKEPYTCLHQDFYRYMDLNSYPRISSSFGDLCRRELDNRIAIVERMEQMKIFNGVDLQRMVQRFQAQQEFLKAAGEGEFVLPPLKSIHDTWLEVLGITNNMLWIPREELGCYVMYIEAVELIFACKAVGRVSPEVWQEIEEGFLSDRRTEEVLTFKGLRDVL